jgi:hypothetical protein
MLLPGQPQFPMSRRGRNSPLSWHSDMFDDDHLLIGRALGVTYRRFDKTESDSVVVPPALIITDSDGSTWTFGFTYNVYGEINVLRNDVDTGEFAQRIEYRKGVVKLFGKSGWRSFSRSRRHFI